MAEAARPTGVVIIGAGQAGLAMSRVLHDRGIEHVVLERGRVAERWRSERWDSLTLLTPNWMSRLPGYSYAGPDPDGYMDMPAVIGYLERYAWSFPAPIETGTMVTAVTRAGPGRGFEVRTTRGVWRAPNVVVATGHSDTPLVPAVAGRLPPDIAQVVPARYRNPDRLPPGGVFVVGASATGIQLADELNRSGRSVTIAVGRHTRLPRTYRGRDILWWFDRMGIFDQTAESVYDIEVSRRQTSLQLVGRPDHATLDLPRLERQGVRLVGHLAGVDGSRLSFAGDLVTCTVAADVRLAQLLRRIDGFVEEGGCGGAGGEPEPFEPFHWPAPAPDSLDLRAAGIATVIWATGFRRDYSWLKVPILDERREIRHKGGITPEAGLYVLGLHFLRRRKSSFIDGVGDDARALGEDIARRLRRFEGTTRPARRDVASRAAARQEEARLAEDVVR